MSVQTPLPDPGSTAEQLIDELTPHGGYRAVLRNRNFLALWVGQVLSQLGDRVVFVVFIALIVQAFGAGDRYSSFLYIAFTIPAILLTAVAGVFVDRWPRRGVLVVTNLLRGAVVILLPWMATQVGPWSIYLMAFLISAATQFFVPAEAATIPMIVTKRDLLTANSLFTTTMMGSIVFGFALGDPLINIFSIGHVHYAIAGLFFAASAALMCVKVGPMCSLAEHDRPAANLQEAIARFKGEMGDGFRYIQAHPLVKHAMLKLALLFSCVVALCILFISFAKTYLFEDPRIAAQKFAYIIAFSGLGMAVGAAWVGHSFTRARRGFMVFGGFIGVGLGLLLLSAVGHVSPHDKIFHLPKFATGFLYLDEVRFTWRMLYTYVLATGMGVAAAFIAIPLQALLHELIPEDKRGKVLGVQFTVLSTSSTLPVLIAGLAVEQVGPGPLFFAIGLPLLLFGVIGLYKRLKLGSDDVLAANW